MSELNNTSDFPHCVQVYTILNLSFCVLNFKVGSNVPEDVIVHVVVLGGERDEHKRLYEATHRLAVVRQLARNLNNYTFRHTGLRVNMPAENRTDRNGINSEYTSAFTFNMSKEI